MTTEPTPAAVPEDLGALPAWPPRRGLEHAAITVEDGQPVLTFLCDCATSTAVTLVGELPPWGDELAFTCAGCGTPHWFWYETRPMS